MSYVPLNVYSGYSFLQSALTVPKIVGLHLKEGLSYCALADRNSLSGAPELVFYCKQRGLRPIIGLNIALHEGEISLYCINEEGYRNLLSYVYAASKGEIETEFCSHHKAGLIAVLDAKRSFLATSFSDHAEEIPARLAKLSSCFDSFYLGLPRPKGNEALRDFLHDFVQTYPYPLLAFPRLAYARAKDAIATSILSSIESGENLEAKTAEGPDCFLSQEEAAKEFSLEEIANTEKIAKEASTFEFSKKRGGLLRFPTPDGSDAASYLRKLSLEGLAKRVPDAGEEYQKRLEHELSVIIPMGYADYFLIVADYVAFAKSKGISVGPGRGSAAGSLVSYCLGIVKPDPLRYGLLFERFLNPERASMPDIDVDFPDTSRDQIERYLQEKYGKERVSHVMTMQTLGPRQSINDVGRVYGYQASETKLLTSRIDPRYDLHWNYRNSTAFRTLVDSDEYYLQFVSLAAKIEGLPRQSGLHAAGIVLNDQPLPEVLPVVYQEGVGLVEQFDKDYLQEQGFLKMDLLGLTNLSTIDRCLQAIERDLGLHLAYEDIPYEDEAAIKLIADGKTMGLFQLESEGMNRAIAEVKPTSLEDVCAILALFRPGPMDFIPNFARRKAGKEEIRYICKELEPILSSTYGIIVYQEQIMQIAVAVAGFRYGQADLLRRAISHKNAEEIAKVKSTFLEGCLAKGHSQKEAEELYALIERFANYGFNKSHSLSYAILACQEAYLKAHYPLQFYSAILDIGAGGKEKLSKLIAEMKRCKIRFLLPNINEANLLFSAKKEGVMFPFTSIADLPYALCSSIVDERNQNGPFFDFFSAVTRLKKYGLTLEHLIRLIDAGAFDCFGLNRASLRLTAPGAISYAELCGGEDGTYASLPFDLPKPALLEVESNKEEDLLAERDAIGMMVSGSPLDRYKDTITRLGAHRLGDLELCKGEMKVVGILSAVKPITTKTGKKMAIVTLYDDASQVEFALFSDAYDRAFPILKVGNPLLGLAKANSRRPGSFILDSLSLLKGEIYE